MRHDQQRLLAGVQVPEPGAPMTQRAPDSMISAVVHTVIPAV
jgi:hypothetical protein